MERADYEENRFGYLRSYSQEELKALKAEMEEEIQWYEDSKGVSKSSLESDRNRADDILEYIEKNKLIKEKIK